MSFLRRAALLQRTKTLMGRRCLVRIVKRDFVYRPLAGSGWRRYDDTPKDYRSLERRGGNWKLKAIGGGGKRLRAAIARARLRLNCLSGLRKAKRRRSEIVASSLRCRFCASDRRYRARSRNYTDSPPPNKATRVEFESVIGEITDRFTRLAKVKRGVNNYDNYTSKYNSNSRRSIEKSSEIGTRRRNNLFFWVIGDQRVVRFRVPRSWQRIKSVV